ncbi:MAG TPA: fused MFS/spermidine synthase [Thermoanaerobaculia bacterium]
MSRRIGLVGLLLFGSGACALVYQTVWLRQFRLIFGASTAASAAVLAIFMGGLGLGGLLLGARADRHARPLAFYGLLELGVAFSAAITPLLLMLVRWIYLATGGSPTLGLTFATVLRLVLATVVLIIPTVLMGGTLPAAARAITAREDIGRRGLSVLYGINTLGAVTGVVLSTFVFLELFGNRMTLFLAALLNVLIALGALLIDRRDTRDAEPALAPESQTSASAAPRRFVLIASALTGFTFLLMELVWYRMLAPLLGGTTFTFGLILAVALLGIGAGGLVYSMRENREATIGAFALSCALEAVFVALPYAEGDGLAMLAMLLRPAGAGLGFSGYVIGWTLITFVVVFPAAFIAGIQFPLLISLIGRGRESVARDIGLTYAWNTAGSIAGSIAGGFGALPLLSAPGTWRAAVWVLVVLAGGAIGVALSRSRLTWKTVAAVFAAVIAIAATRATGPTAAWRHTPIGAGRAEIEKPSRNHTKEFIHARRRTIEWEVDGVESSLALSKSDGYAFVVNGKSDGHAILDGGTQIMGGILGAMLHPQPKNALVIGLGTGTTAGWLGAVPEVDRVDVFEIEPAIARIAAACEDVNHKPLKNPKIHISYGDARELLLTSRQRYDVISSEPSNPYRSGIASLLTTDFYEAAASRLADGGMFLQFLQAYEIDSATLRMVYATFGQVFPYVETWETRRGDLLLVGTMKPIVYDANALRARLARDPYRSAILAVWRAVDLEGVLAHYVAGQETSAALADGGLTNTDDRTRIEYGFARTLGNNAFFQINDLRELARRKLDDLPAVSGTVNVGLVRDQRLSLIASEAAYPPDLATLNPDQQMRVRAYIAHAQGDYEGALRAWVGQRTRPTQPTDLLTFAESYANRAEEAVVPYIDELRAYKPAEADYVLARLRWKQKRYPEAAAALRECLVRMRTDPWSMPMLYGRVLELSVDIGVADPAAGRAFYDLLAVPFAAHASDSQRMLTRLQLATNLTKGQCNPLAIEALQPFEVAVPWDRFFLRSRLTCYERFNHPLLAKARKDWDEYLKNEPLPLSATVR